MPMSIPRRSTALALSMAALLVCATAGAADPPKQAGAAKPKPSDPVMTRAELRVCMAKQDRNRAQTEELEAERKKISDEKALLQKQGDELKVPLSPPTDLTDAEAVNRYNEQARARNEQVRLRDAAVDVLIARTNAFNDSVQAAQAGRADYAATCEKRRYDERDEAAIRSGK